MHFIYEAIIVGFYVLFLYYLIKFFDFYIPFELFIIGFIKHLVGYYSNLHSYYCNNGYSCKKINQIAINNYIFNQSLIEGFLFIIVGYFLSYFIKSKYILYFFIGFILHVSSELLQLHTYYCNSYCFTNIAH